MFDLLEEQAQTDQLGRLAQYIQRQWIESEVFTLRGGQCGLPLYLLIELLDREAKLTAITIRLVSDNKLKRIQRRTTKNNQAKLFTSWEKYENNEKTTAQLLRTCLRLNGPARSN